MLQLASICQTFARILLVTFAYLISPACTSVLMTKSPPTPNQAANGDCNSEATTCTIDSNGCYACLQAYDDAGCDDSPDNCGELGLSYCCAFGDDPACGTNTALIAWVGETIDMRVCGRDSISPLRWSHDKGATH